jgi:hypothetical protein
MTTPNENIKSSHLLNVNSCINYAVSLSTRRTPEESYKDAIVLLAKAQEELTKILTNMKGTP